MSWGPLQPAHVDFSGSDGPTAPDYGDRYHGRAGALTQAGQVFLAGNQLPGRWAGRSRFVVLETGFGLGNNFLATWQAWRQDPQRCGQLVFVSLDKHPLSRDDLARAHAHSPVPDLADALLAQWPPATPDMHLLDFDGGQVRLLLALGDIARVLPELVLQADALFLDGFAPRLNPAMWDPHTLRHLARLAAPGCTVATWSVAGAVRQALQAAGFVVEKVPGIGGKWETTRGVYAPRHRALAPPGRRPQDGVRQVAVVGAGLAGAAVARALAGQGLAVTVLERRSAPALETSGNAGGLFHSIVHAQDGTHARWLRAAALHGARVLRPLLAAGQVAGALDGLLRGERVLDAAAMQALLQRLGLQDDHVQVLADALPDGRPAWLFAEGGWAAPAELVAHWLATPGVTTRCDSVVADLQRPGERWQLRDERGLMLAEADAVVLCNAHDALRLLGAPAWPLQRVRGQTTLLPAGLPGLPRLYRPVADGGYALELADGQVLCGAVSQPDDLDGSVRDVDHAQHLAILRRLTGWTGTVAPDQLGGRVGWRLVADDRLPLLGPVPDLSSPASQRLTQCRQMPRQHGLWLFTALGSRGLTQAALGGELLAAWLTGAPCPAPAALMDALDPARFAVRAARQADRSA